MNNFKELNKYIVGRRSIRNFNNKEISRDDFLKMLQAAVMAPNGCRAEPWFFYIVSNQEIIEKMRAAVISSNPKSDFCKKYQTFHNARYVIAVCVDDQKRWFNRELKGTEGVGIKALDNPNYLSAAAAIQNLLLAAHALNLGACWIGVIDLFRKSLEKIIKTESDHRLIAVIAIGHYDEIPPAPKRKSLDEVYKFID